MALTSRLGGAGGAPARGGGAGEGGRGRQSERWAGELEVCERERSDGWRREMQRRERHTENGRRERGNCKMQMQMQHLLDLLQCLVLPHFEDAARDGLPAGVSLRGWFVSFLLSPFPSSLSSL
jgi:hypothetical protein